VLGRDKKKNSGPKKIFEMLGAILNNTSQLQERAGQGPNQRSDSDTAEIELPIPVENRMAFDELEELMMTDSAARKKLVFVYFT
jgi:hypothetical protein